MMTALPVFALVVTCLAAIVQHTAAICCRETRGIYCLDCTKKTPYCSYGKCNIFGCACASACRKNCNPWVTEKSRGWLRGADYSCQCRNKRRRDAEDVEGQEDEDQGEEDQDDQGENWGPDKMFAELDTDGDGYISLDELSTVLQGYPDINAAFKEMDANDDGKIDRQEFDSDLQ
ncbi:uncharacterized protein LOC106165319 [Lingula anatina]|uniref:Uncharacterized protein LOC106165319 n=1 Tax=Lingula anatina TaxID=7574 RepID=A0A1S3IN29_LINAN|nr:uncharacterized protein LOC106165319 [Lingula anatina]|eukprot:XP_013398944.1 uncharacterized protein LOC106165319 [Lingula anatina]